MQGKGGVLFLMCCFVSCLLLQHSVASGIQNTQKCSLLSEVQSTSTGGFLARLSGIITGRVPENSTSRPESSLSEWFCSTTWATSHESHEHPVSSFLVSCVGTPASGFLLAGPCLQHLSESLGSWWGLFQICSCLRYSASALRVVAAPTICFPVFFRIILYP